MISPGSNEELFFSNPNSTFLLIHKSVAVMLKNCVWQNLQNISYEKPFHKQNLVKRFYVKDNYIKRGVIENQDFTMNVFKKICIALKTLATTDSRTTIFSHSASKTGGPDTFWGQFKELGCKETGLGFLILGPILGWPQNQFSLISSWSCSASQKNPQLEEAWG